MAVWQDLKGPVETWLAEGRRVALATVLSTWGSAPRPAGAALAVAEGGAFAGSVTAGCVEAALVEEARAVLAGASPKRLRYGVSDDRAWSLGLACGGTVELWLAPLDEACWRTSWTQVDARRPALWATVVGGPAEWLGRTCLAAARTSRSADADGGLELLAGSPALGEAIAGWRGGSGSGGIEGLGEPGLIEVLAKAEGWGAGAGGGAGEGDGRDHGEGRTAAGGEDRGPSPARLEVFVSPLRPRRRLVVIGATHIAQALVRLAAVLDLETVVIDPRAAFASRERFAAVDDLRVAWPAAALAALTLDAATAVAVLSHDPKLDDEALALALRSPAGYVGALGSRRTQAERRERLAALGLDEADLARLRGPIGLDIGARTPTEIALAILGQVVADARGAGGTAR